MEDVEKGNSIRIQSFKHDSSLHRTWDYAMVIEKNDDFIAVASKVSRVVESDGRIWYTKEPAVSIFFFKEWYNIIAMLRGEEIYYYCNIASPSLIDGNVIKYIDYDLDLKLSPNNIITTLDEKEYEYHRKKYNYSSNLDVVCKHSLKKVASKMKKRDFPFDDDKIWDFYEEFEELRNKEHSEVN